MVATSVRGILCAPCAVVTITSEPSAVTVPETNCLSALVTTSGCLSEENWLTSAQSIVTSPAYVVFRTSFLPSILTTAPLKWSPFFSDTSSARNAAAQQTRDTTTNEQTFFNTSSLFSLVRLRAENWLTGASFGFLHLLLLQMFTHLGWRAPQSSVGVSQSGGERFIPSVSGNFVFSSNRGRATSSLLTCLPRRGDRTRPGFEEFPQNPCAPQFLKP